MRKNTNTKAKIGELLLMLGISLFVIGAIGFIAGYLSQELTPAITVFALIFIAAGLGMKRRSELHEN
jgi:hypothetical protein